MTVQVKELEARTEAKNQYGATTESHEPGSASVDSRASGSELIAGAAGVSIEVQASRLGDKRLKAAQRRSIASHIGRFQGNTHLQRVVASLRSEPEPQESPERSSGREDHAGDRSAPAAAPPPPDSPGVSVNPTGNGTSPRGSSASSGPDAPGEPAANGARPSVTPPAPNAPPRTGSDAGADAPSGGGRAGTKAAPAASSVDTSSTEAVLTSLAGVPASSFGEALSQAAAAAPGIQAHEKSELESSFPQIEQPTGLPAKPRSKEPPATTVAAGQVPTPMVSSAGPANAASGASSVVASGPLPASRVSTAAPEPAEDSGDSWWDWLVNKVSNFVSSLPVRDSGLSTSAGERSRVDLGGAANPEQDAEYRKTTDAEVAARHSESDAATTQDFGEHDIYPTLPTERMRPSTKPSAPGRTKGTPSPNPPALPADARAEFDQRSTPALSAKVKEQVDKHHQDQETYEKQSKQVREDGEKRIAEGTAQAQAQQKNLRTQAQSEVAAKREEWRSENRKVQEGYAAKSTAKQEEIDQKIQTKVQTSETRADEELTAAETKAEKARIEAETKAAQKKQEAQNKPKSWWQSVKGAISDAFDTIKGAINSIFDELRAAVKTIIDTAKSVVRGLIDAARDAVIGFIKEFGEFVKGLVTFALAAFPELAAKARAWIDKKVNQAAEAVNQAAEALKTATDAILDFVGAALDAALSVLQAAFNAVLDILEFLAKLPFEAMEALEKLLDLLQKFGPFLEGAQKVQDDPDTVIEGIKTSVGAMVAAVPAQAMAKLEEFSGLLGGDVEVTPAAGAPAAAAPAPAIAIQRQPAPSTAAPAKRHVSAGTHIKGIIRHLGKGLSHLKDHWWDELKKVGWNLLWPWPAVWGDLKDIWKEIKAAWSAISDFKVGKALDSVLTIGQKVNSILGNLYGWFFIASVLIGAIIGAFFGGAGAIPGALAGAAFAGEVGEALVAALIATEAAVIVKSVADLAIGNDTSEEDEEDYGKIGGSTLTIAITVALLLLGELAAKLAKSIWEAVAGLFKGEKAPEINVKVEGEAKAGEAPEIKPEENAPESKTGDDTVPEADSQKGVAAERTTADGHKIKVLEDGRIFICTTCEELHFNFADELKENPDLQQKLDVAKAEVDPAIKAEKIEQLQKELADARQKKLNPESPEGEPPKSDSPASRIVSRLKDLKQRAFEALRRIDEMLPDANPNKRTLKNEVEQIRGQLKDADAVAKGATPEELDGLVKPELDSAEGRLDIVEDQLPQGPLQEPPGKLPEPADVAPPQPTIDPNVSVAKQLEGKGQLRDLRTNPNLEGVNIEELLQKTPAELDAMKNAGTLDPGTHRQIMKAFEGRDLGKRGGS